MGAGGFIGGTIAERLAQSGVDVLSLTRSDVDLLANGAADKLAGYLQPDDVFIAVSAIAPCKNATMLRDNMIMAEAMVSALSKSPVKHVINVSSDAVFADSEEPLTEDSVMAPDNPHGVMHLAREIMFKTLDIPLAIIRPTLVYGANDPHNGYGPNKFRRLANKGEPISLFGEGEERRDHVLVDDIAEIATRIVMLGSTGDLNIASGDVTSFRDVADKVVQLAQRPVEIKASPRNGPMPHNGYRPFDISATQQAFTDFSYTPLDQGLSQVQQKEFANG